MDPLQHTSQTVITCYDILDAALAGGVKDFTDGKYLGNPDTLYEVAQAQQANWLLDQVGCKAGFRLLDIGCGNGRLLAAAAERGAEAVGLTISEQQVRQNQKRGLDARLLNYRHIPEAWNQSFDGIIANGSAEHFVQVADAIAGKQNAIYQELFEICHRILKPGGRFATTIIHFAKPVDPVAIAKGSKAHPKRSDNYHLAKVLLEDFGGWYPIEGQLKTCAKDWFTRANGEDGTEDYHWTSETWLKIMKRKIPFSPKVWFALLGKLFQHPKATWSMIDDLVISQSWMWQFRPQGNAGAPTRLMRDVWQRIDS